MMPGGQEPSVFPSERAGLSRRTLFAIAVVGVIAAVAYAFAPVDRAATQYLLQVSDLPAESTIVAPLAIARSSLDRLKVTIPCEQPGSVFSSARDPAEFELAGATSESSPFGLPAFGDPVHMTISASAVSIRLGSELLLAAPIDEVPPCIARMQYDDGHWDLNVQGQVSSVAAPSPWFSEAQITGPAASSSVSEVSVTTSELESSPSAVQLALGLLTVVSLVVSMSVASRRLGGSDSDRRYWSLRSLVGLVSAVDVAVIGVLIAWLILLPPQIDEGWMRAITGAYEGYGDFLPIYDVAAPLPLGYWFFWLQNFWLSLSSSPAIMRMLPLALGLGVWVGLRSVARSLRIPGRQGSVWLMAVVFVTGFGAFGMTLRAEPIVMVLMTASVAIGLRFGQRPSSGLLAGWAVIVALGLSVHPSAVVVLAPLAIVWPNVWKWLKSSDSNRASGIVHGLGFVSLTVLLAVIDSNVVTKLEIFRATRSDGQHGFGIFDERMRYKFLVDHGPTMHRFFVVVMVAAVGALLLRLWSRDRKSQFPARTLGVGLVLLAVTPSKWFWHFGALVPIAALAAAIEFRAVQGWRRIAALGGLALAFGWVWSDALPWTELDLRTQRWWSGATNFLPFDLTDPVVWVVLAGVVSVLGVVVTRWRPTAVVWNPVEAIAVLAAGLVIGVTMATFALDVARTDGWTYGRQSLADLTGSGNCGLGEEIRIPERGSVDEAALSVSDRNFDTGALTDWVPVSTLGGDATADVMITPELLQYFGCIDLPLSQGGVVQSPDMMVLTPVIAWQAAFASAALSDDYYRMPVSIPPRGDDARLIVIVSQEYLTGSPARATHQFQIDSG